MKPVTRLDDLKARNQGKTTWREPIINDGNSVSFMVQEPPGTKYERRDVLRFSLRTRSARRSESWRSSPRTRIA